MARLESTLEEVITRVDKLKPNAYTDEQIAEAIEHFGGSVVIEGSGDSIVDASYDSETRVLTLTKGYATTWVIVPEE